MEHKIHFSLLIFNNIYSHSFTKYVMNLCFQAWRTSERDERAGKKLKKKVWEDRRD